jgi:hypothetical protein
MFLYSEDEEDVQCVIMEQYREQHEEDMNGDHWVAPVPPCERKMRKIPMMASVPPSMPTQVLITRVDEAYLRQKTPVFALCCDDADDKVKQTLCQLGPHTIVRGICDLVTGCISREVYPYLENPIYWLAGCSLSAGRGSDVDMLTDVREILEAPDEQMLLEAFEYPPIHTDDLPLYM